VNLPQARGATSAHGTWSGQPVAEHRSFAHQATYVIPFPVLSDSDAKVLEAFHLVKKVGDGTHAAEVIRHRPGSCFRKDASRNLDPGIVRDRPHGHGALRAFRPRLQNLHRLVGMRQVWVACLDEAPVGMVIASVREGTAYVEEMDVLPAYGRRGLGARLLGSVCDWARARGYAAVTLSTFRDVPWNGPFYRKQGFVDLPLAIWTPWMVAIREQEARHGLQVAARVFMRRPLRGLPAV